jgi:subtilisin family serine protease
VKRAVALVATLLTALVIGAPPATAAPVARRTVVVKVRDLSVDRGAVAGALGGSIARDVADDTFVVDGALADATTPPGVEWIAPDTTYRAARTPRDVCYLACAAAPDGQKELATIDAPAAWDVTTGSPSVTVAVLDGTVDASHMDLAGKVTVGPTFVTNGCDDASPAEASHATAVAGLVGANTDNTFGIASLGWQTRVLAVTVLDACGVGTASEVSAGIRYATEHGARIVNLSLSGVPNPVLGDAVRYAQDRGVLVVAAAGNGGTVTPSYPAAYDGVLAVGSTAPDGTRTSAFSNHGSWVDIWAPGESVVSTSTLPGGYTSFDGTSFASPMVAAAAALLFAHRPTATASDVVDRLLRTTTPLPGTPGVLDAGHALTDDPGGFVLAASDGGAFTFGTAQYRGSAGGIRLNQPIVGAATAGAAGYWEVARDGGVFAYGVPYLGSMGGTRLNRPVVGMAATPSGRGYWLVASDGGIFTFGDAVFAGSTGAMRLVSPIVGMAPTPSGRGYWLAAGDGGIFSFGGAPFFGSGVGNAGPGVTGMAVAPDGIGYWLARADGVVLSFGTAYQGARTGHLNAPIVAIGSA